MGEYLRTEIRMKELCIDIEEYKALIHKLKAEKLRAEMQYAQEQITFEKLDTLLANLDEPIERYEQSIEDATIAIGECEGYLAELDYIDNGNAYGW